MTTIVESNLTEEKIAFMRQKIEAQTPVHSKRFLDSLFLQSQIMGRERQAKSLVSYLGSMNNGFVEPFISVNGRSGSGKSSVVKMVCSSFSDKICTKFVNLRKSSTIFGSANAILYELGGEELKNNLGLDSVISDIENRISDILFTEQKKFFVLVLDEYDVIFSDKRANPSDFVYKLCIIIENLRAKGLWLSIITISNNSFSDYALDDRIKSRMGNSDVFFEPYSEYEIYDILYDRAEKASCKISDDTLRYIAKICSDDHGDARRAIDLLRISSELSDGNILKKDVDLANEKTNNDNIEKILLCSSKNFKRAFVALSRLSYLTGKDPTTSEIYHQYRFLLPKDTTPIKQRRFNDVMQEMSQCGLCYPNVSYNGRGGMNAKYSLMVPSQYIGVLAPRKWEKIVELKKKRDEFLNNPKFHGFSHRSKINRFEEEKKWRRLVGLDYTI